MEEIKELNERFNNLIKDKAYLLDVMYEITRSQSPMDMYDLAVSALKQYGKEPAPLEES
jgi:hypothetical protein